MFQVVCLGNPLTHEVLMVLKYLVLYSVEIYTGRELEMFANAISKYLSFLHCEQLADLNYRGSLSHDNPVDTY